MTINDTKYYESNTATVGEAQSDLTRNPETVTHTRNGDFEPKLLSFRTISVLSPLKNPGIDQGIEATILTPQPLLMPETKEIVADAASGDAWTSSTPWKGGRTGVGRSTLGTIDNYI